MKFKKMIVMIATAMITISSAMPVCAETKWSTEVGYKTAIPAIPVLGENSPIYRSHESLAGYTTTDGHYFDVEKTQGEYKDALLKIAEPLMKHYNDTVPELIHTSYLSGNSENFLYHIGLIPHYDDPTPYYISNKLIDTADKSKEMPNSDGSPIPNAGVPKYIWINAADVGQVITNKNFQNNETVLDCVMDRSYLNCTKEELEDNDTSYAHISPTEAMELFAYKPADITPVIEDFGSYTIKEGLNIIPMTFTADSIGASWDYDVPVIGYPEEGTKKDIIPPTSNEPSSDSTTPTDGTTIDKDSMNPTVDATGLRNKKDNNKDNGNKDTLSNLHSERAKKFIMIVIVPIGAGSALFFLFFIKRRKIRFHGIFSEEAIAGITEKGQKDPETINYWLISNHIDAVNNKKETLNIMFGMLHECGVQSYLPPDSRMTITAMYEDGTAVITSLNDVKANETDMINFLCSVRNSKDTDRSAKIDITITEANKGINIHYVINM